VEYPNGSTHEVPKQSNLNAHCERWIKSVKTEVLSQLILFGEVSSRHALSTYVSHFHTERNHQGKGNIVLFPMATDRIGDVIGQIHTRGRLGGSNPHSLP
jgi:hypothetical protein